MPVKDQLYSRARAGHEFFVRAVPEKSIPSDRDVAFDNDSYRRRDRVFECLRSLVFFRVLVARQPWSVIVRESGSVQ